MQWGEEKLGQRSLKEDKSGPAQDVNKLIRQCEVFTHFRFSPRAVWLMQRLCVTSDAGCPAADAGSVYCSENNCGSAGLMGS